MLELFHWEPNGSWLKPLIVLHEKQRPFQSHYVDVLALEQFGPAMPEPSRETRLNPEGEGPLLVHDGRQITESFFMMEYLEDVFPNPPLRPADALGHARILTWARFINEVFMPAASTLGCHRYLVPRLRGQDRSRFEAMFTRMSMQHLRDGWRMALADDYPAELLEDSKRKVGIAVHRIEDALTSTEWLVGDRYSLADIDAFAICNSLPALTPELVNGTATPRLIEWLNRIRERPAVQAALAMSRTGKPEEAFAPGPEHSRWG